MTDSSIAVPVSSSEKKSLIRRFYESTLTPAHANVVTYARESGHAVRQGGEALITGGVLGLLDAETGLDMKIMGHDIPIDAALALIGFAGSIVMAHEPYGIGADMRNVGSDALAIFSYRKAKAWREKGKTIPPVHGEQADPIELAMRDL